MQNLRPAASKNIILRLGHHQDIQGHHQDIQGHHQDIQGHHQDIQVTIYINQSESADFGKNRCKKKLFSITRSIFKLILF